MSLKLLIPGGAGYIGSHMVKYAQAADCEVVVLDDFSTGHEWAVRDCEILNVNLLDKEKLSSYLKGRHFDGVIHFAAKSLVGESIKSPSLYFENNVAGSLNLVGEMLRNGVNNLVFSSTAAVYGNPSTSCIEESHSTEPINPYGKSKLMVENLLSDICAVEDLNAVSFRYFNAAGADESGLIGEAHDPETHLIPNILKSVLSKNSDLRVFGDDYDTIDGTCIRDYVHVLDLAQAHLLGLKFMEDNPGFSFFNLGNGKGFSVLEVIDSCSRVVGEKIEHSIESRRPGDPSELVADSRKAIDSLGWEPKFPQLDRIVESAWNWHKTAAGGV